ncbi:hypothetical protein DICSQDRAFT_65172 [Dichomitus squalens LYAD-421 SS1]|uniref:Uncharacterized protein n=1 Tax=Dichomitus squalens (strain LYAD-421) TaxID=732165 RepID=R7STZ0_DICSQ|nr:uncharacterized protein DICSQDRAFT_65172 [Dichomitus squalens LYAD-421 SS1]EJF59388.1 hypothetical protein DICSQDRAFT_65172 [Dichomitus squalens LYAD-421 SS1]
MSGRSTLHDEVARSYILHAMLRDLADPPYELELEELAARLQTHMHVLESIRSTRYLNARGPVPKLDTPSLSLVWEYAKDPAQHGRFLHMLRVSPHVFEVIAELIRDHPVFHNGSNNPQAPVEQQLAITLFRMGRFGNAASLEDIAREAGCSEGSKEQEKKWIDQQVGFRGLWREGWVMYDGTIIVLYARPGLDGDAYYTRKCNYGLNLQVSSIMSTTGSLNKLSW